MSTRTTLKRFEKLRFHTLLSPPWKMQLRTRHQGSRERITSDICFAITQNVSVNGWDIAFCMWCLDVTGKNESVGSYKEHWMDKSTRQDLKNIWEEMSFLLSCVWVKDLRISVTQRFFSSRWEGSPRICHLSKLMTVKDNAASMSYVNVGYQTEVIRLWTKACVHALQSLHTMNKIESDSNVACLQYNKKKSGGFGEATRCHQRRKWSGFSRDFSDDSEKLRCPEDDTTKGVWVALEALFEEGRRSRWLKVGCAKHVSGQVGKRVMSCSFLCPESLRNSKNNSLWYVARDARLWVPATQSKDMHVRRTFCGIRSGPNVTTGVVSMQRSHTSDLVRFSAQMLRRWLTKSSWNYDDVQNASTDRRPWKCYVCLRCQNPGQHRSNPESMGQGRKATASCPWVEHDRRTKWTWAEMTFSRFPDDYAKYDKDLTLYPNKTSILCAMQDMIKFVENDRLKMGVPVIKTG